MKTGLHRLIRLVVCLWVAGAACAFGEVHANAHRFLNKVEKEVPEIFYLPLAGSNPAEPGRAALRRMERDDAWLKAVMGLVKDREIEFRFEAMRLDDAAEAKSFPTAFCWRREGKCGIVLRRFQDAKSQWIVPWDSGQNWMMIVFELMNLEGFSATERVFRSESELIESFARTEFRAMQRANDVFYREWAPYCEKMGAKVEMSLIPWFNRNVTMGEEEWGKRAVESAELKEYREWILMSGMHRLKKGDGEVE